jgi:hypothetical protein
MACGIIACLHSVLNNLESITLEDGSILDRFFKAVQAKSPEERALALEAMEEFK